MNPEANKLIAKLAQNKQRPSSVQNELNPTTSTRVMSGSLPSSVPQRGMSTRIYGKIDEDEDSSDEEEAIGGDPVAPTTTQAQVRESMEFTNHLSQSTNTTQATLNPDIIRTSARTASIMSDKTTNLPANSDGCCTIF